MARGRPVVVNQAALALALIIASSQVAFGQAGPDRPGLRVSVPKINLLGLAATTPISLNIGGSGSSVVLPGVSVSGLATVSAASISASDKGASVILPGATAAGLATVTAASVDVTREGASVVLPGASVAGLATVTAASVNVTRQGATVVLPNVDVAGISVTSTPLSVDLTGQGSLLGLPAVTVNVAGQPVLTVLGNSTVEDILNQISPITQLLASIGSAEAFAPVDQLLNGLALGDAASSGCAAPESAAAATTTSPTSDIWTWNAFSAGQTDHDGFRINGGGGANCGSSLPFQSLQRTQLPGIVWDASSAFGFKKKGTFHLGFSGGRSEMDTKIKASTALRDAGIAQGGTAKLTSWSVGGFSLLTKDNWYAGSAVGGAWGRTESQNSVLGSASDYATSSVVVAAFAGSIVPITDTMRFDLRSTLSYQVTVGAAHVDSIGMAYGDHTIEAADAIVSGRLFGVVRQGELTLRPFLQAGVTHHLRYNNQLEIGGVAFSLQEADTSLFAGGGLDFEISRSLQLSVGVRHDYSRHDESLTGRLGFSARLN